MTDQLADYGLTVGSPAVESVGAIAFGPDDILFVADNDGAKIVAVNVDDPSTQAATGPLDVEQLDTKLASFLGCTVEQVAIRALAVHPRTGNAYLSVMRGTGDGGRPVIIRVDRATASISEFALIDVSFAEYDLTDAPAPHDPRVDVRLGEGEEAKFTGRKFRLARIPIGMSVVADRGFMNGPRVVAGMSNEEFSSSLRRIPFPFTGASAATSLEIFHVSHGQWE